MRALVVTEFIGLDGIVDSPRGESDVVSITLTEAGRGKQYLRLVGIAKLCCEVVR